MRFAGLGGLGAWSLDEGACRLAPLQASLNTTPVRDVSPAGEGRVWRLSRDPDEAVRDTDPERARALADAIVQQLIETTPNEIASLGRRPERLRRGLPLP